MEKLIKKLDLNDYITNFSKLFSREKSVILEGDINIHYKIISELSNYNFNPPKNTINLDSQLMHIQKQGVLKVYEIYEFVKIINYFLYLKRFNFEGKLLEWMEKIVIPNDIIKICDYFDENSKLKSGISEDYDNIKESISRNKEETKQSLYKLVNSSKLKPYLVDMQVHYINQEECLLVRGGFNHELNGSVIDRLNTGFLYVVTNSISELK